MSSHLRAVLVVGAAVMVSAAPARGDQIALTGGLLDWVVSSGPASSGGAVTLAGDRGFTFTGSWRGGFDAPVGDVMPPGTPIALHGGATSADFQGNATLDGISYPGFGSLDSPFGGSLQITTAAATLPVVLSPPAQITAPFTLDFLFAGPGIEHSLIGSGTATIFLEQDLGFEVPSWRVTGIRAVLSSAESPVPEPATLLLMAPGLGWALRRARTRSLA
jgi:hypothetical protein